MDRLFLKRLFTGETGTFGNFNDWCMSCELPWKDIFLPGFSCVRAGVYVCEFIETPKHPDGVYHLLAVPDCSMVEIHVGNFGGDISKGYQSDITGCIVLGVSVGFVTNARGLKQLGVGSSRIAIECFQKKMGGREFELEIIDTFKEPL